MLAADVVEGDNDFHVHVDLPGVAPEDLDMNVANGFLHIKAERKQGSYLLFYYYMLLLLVSHEFV